MAILDKCLLCDGKAVGDWDAGNAEVFRVECATCGKYNITETAARLLEEEPAKGDRYKLSGASRNAAARGGLLTINSSNLPELVKSAPVPKTPFDAIDRLAQLVHEYLPQITGGVTS